MELDPRQLLLSRRLGEFREDPFCYFAVDDFLPADAYRELLETYPGEVAYSYNDEGKAGFRSSEVPEAVERFCDDHPLWKQLLEILGSDEFIDDAHETLRRPLVAARPWVGRKPWYNCTQREVPHTPLGYALQEPVRTTFQFSQLGPDAEVVPHADAPRKLISFLIYFRDPDWQDDWGGGTEYCAPLDPARARQWSQTARISFEEFKTIGETAFVGNRLAGFVRSSASFHGVRPLACPADRSRKALLINLKRIKWSKRHDP